MPCSVLYGERMTTPTHPPMALAAGYLKGGTGKSTTAVHLALALATEGDDVALLDTDQANATTTMWRRVAGDEWPANVTVERWHEGGEESAAEACERLRQSHRHLVVDTGPGGRKVLADVLSVARDLVCPILATPAEVMSLRPTLEVASQAATDHGIGLHVLLTKVRKNSVHLREARERLDALGLPVLDATVTLLDRYQDATGTVPTDLGEYADVLEELITERADA